MGTHPIFEPDFDCLTGMVIAIGIGVLARIFAYSLDLSERPELNSITNAYHRLTETRYAHNQSPLARALFGVCGHDATVWFGLLCAFDFIGARLIGSISRHYYPKADESLIVRLAWLNPAMIVACGGLSAGIVSNALILACWFTTLERHASLSALFLVLSSIDRFYPIQLIIPICLLFNDKRVIVAVVAWCGTIGAAVATLGGCDPLELVSNWRMILQLTDYEPGLNYSWYMLIELFDHFRQFFILIIQIQMFCYVVPLCFRFKPDIAIKYLIPLIYVFAPYSTLSDVALVLSILPMFEAGRRQFFGLLVLLTSLLLCPIMWYVWADSMAGNANFYFATTLAVIIGSIILLHDSLFAELAKIEKSGLSVRLERPLSKN